LHYIGIKIFSQAHTTNDLTGVYIKLRDFFDWSIFMTRTGFVKGMAIGVMTGAAIGMAMAPRGKNSKSAAGKALKAAGEVIDNITGMWS
jgi:hypothetical protein